MVVLNELRLLGGEGGGLIYRKILILFGVKLSHWGELVNFWHWGGAASLGL